MSQPSHAHDHAQGHDHGHAHEHGHAHDHDHGTEPGEPLDPASRSLAGALKSSFAALKFVMLLLAAAFLFSGVFRVKEGEVGLKLFLGALDGEPGARVLKPGMHFAWPQPLGQAIVISTTPRQLGLERAFWFKPVPGDELKKPEEITDAKPGLVPGEDGALLTGDRNLVHGRWSVVYQAAPEGAEDYARQTGSPEAAERLVRCAAERAVLRQTAGVTADAFVRGAVSWEPAQADMQRQLDALRSGLRVVKLALTARTPPLTVGRAFQAVTEAESERARALEDAQRTRSEILNAAAGARHPEFLNALDDYESARRAGPPAAVEAAERRLDALFASARDAGKVSELLAQAGADYTRAVESARSSADTFTRLLPAYAENPGLFRARVWESARREIMAGDIEKFFLPEGGKDLYLELNRDPALKKRREEARYRREDRERKPDGK